MKSVCSVFSVVVVVDDDDDVDDVDGSSSEKGKTCFKNLSCFSYKFPLSKGCFLKESIYRMNCDFKWGKKNISCTTSSQRKKKKTTHQKIAPKTAI